MRTGFALLLFVAAAALPTSAAAGDVGYVNLGKAVRDTAEGKKAFGEIETFTKERQAEVNAADANARAAAAKCETLKAEARRTCEASAKTAAAAAAELIGKSNEAVVERQKATDTRIAGRMIRILPKLAAAHKLSLIQPENTALYISPKVDFTAELVKRYDAGEGKTEEDLAAELREKNAALEAKVAALEKAAAKPATGKN